MGQKIDASKEVGNALGHRRQQPASGQAFAYAPTPKYATEGARAPTVADPCTPQSREKRGPKKTRLPMGQPPSTGKASNPSRS